MPDLYLIIDILAKIIVAGGVVVLFLGNWYCWKLIKPRPVSDDEAIDELTSQGVSPACFHGNDWEETEIASPVSGLIRMFIADRSAKKTIILVHGLGTNHFSMAKYHSLFNAGEWNLVLFNFRFTESSQHVLPSFGAYEQHDLSAVIRFVKKRFPDTLTGALGESLGGATLLELLKSDIPLDFAITDSAYSDFSSLAASLIKPGFIPGELRKILISSADIFIRFHAQFSLHAIKPCESASRSEIPLLIVHGDADTLVPVGMAHEIFEKRVNRKITQVMTIPEAGHGKAVLTDPVTYKATVESFLKGITTRF